MTKGRRLLFSALVTLGVLGSAEAVCRTLFGTPVVPVVVRMPDGSEGLFTEEGGTLRPKLAEHAAWWPAGPKDPARPRIVMLGESSLAGPPDDPRLAARILGEILQADVVNLAVGGMDTGHLLATVPGALALDPDLVVIYAGHNDLGNAVFSPRFSQPGAVAMARVRALLGHSRVFELLEAAWRGQDERQVVVQWDRADQALGAAERVVVLREQEARMGEVVGRLRAAGLPVLLSTVASNAFFPSVSWTCPERLEALGVPPSRTAVVSVAAVDRGALAAAMEQEPCRDLDLVDARLRWEEDRPAAVATLLALRDEDPKPLRAPRAVNEALRRVAASQDAELVDSARLFAERGGGVEPPAWFRDPVHFSEDGHRALAAALAPAAARLLELPAPAVSWPPSPRFDATACLSAQCRRRGVQSDDRRSPARGAPPPRPP